MKSALYFDTAEGFGQWTVAVSSDADSFLRSTHKKDISTFNVTVKKIKELSCGHFTDNNQKRLSGSTTEVPVFEAKVSRNLRLVYQIDIIPGDDNEQQAIKIFGIYTHEQMDHRLWSSISSQLRKKGKEYRKRCAVRKRADQASTFIPAFFPPLPVVLPSEIEDLPNLRPDETAQIHSRLVVEKYVTFSQPFLNTILADVEATFPYMVSSQEKRIIEHPRSCYVIGRSGTGKTTTMLFKMLLIERTFQLMESNSSPPRQVFVTKSRVLAKKVQEYFAKLANSLTMASQSYTDLTSRPRASQYHAEPGLVHEDDDFEWRTDLPVKYSDLEQRHFPLFITFDGLCDMLEADMGAQPLTATSHINVKRHTGVITFESFRESYWSHFPEPLTRGLDPALVFSEIIGIIEGSAETLSDQKPYLSRDAYLDLSTRRQSTFADLRCKVYQLFELYVHEKKLRGEYDTGDRTHQILKHFTERGIPGQDLDHIYIDEVQDNMLIDTMVLRALCSNADGFFWAGDTAQTIYVGSSFHFRALKAFQWKIEDQYRRKHSLGAQQPPEMFQLAVNYRSHAGIVDCAHSIIDLITTFWKDSIDRLSPEMGIVDGVKPIFFNNEDRAQLEQFIFCDGGDPIEFGAQQCIIVRNETAKEKLRRKVGDIGLVLTVYESKGLEFNDVLLYNFFADSSAGLAQWRVVLNAIEQDPRNPPPQFDHIRHASICNELKSLYVAITRARENIWIADGSETGEPMRMFWTKKGLINNHTRGSDAPRLASSSTPEEWAAEGRELFNAKRFFQAKHCYFKAGLHLLASIADAYDLREKARNVIGTSTQKVLERRSFFAEAANSFFECAKVTKASGHSKDSMTYLRISGECFEQADKKYQAAQIFCHIQDYTHAAELYRDIEKFDEAVAIVKSHKDEMKLKVVQDVIKFARLAYFSNGQMKKGHELFDSVEEEVKYLEEGGIDDALADLLERIGRVREAAELHRSKGRRQQAIALFLREADNKTALHQAQECIIEEFWCRISFGVHPDIVRSKPVKRLMRFASRLDATSMEKTKAAELSMFMAIIENRTSQLRALGLKFHRMHYSAAALLCLDQYFSRAFRFQDLVLVDAVEELGLFHTYVNLLSTAAFRTDLSHEATVATLFGFRRNTANELLVPQNTWLHSEILKLRPSNMPRDPDPNLKLPVLELRGLFQRVLQIHLKQRIIAENEECARSKAFLPCIPFAVSGLCTQSECPKAHVSPAKIDSIYYNMRVRLHFQQIVIVQLLKDNAHEEVEVRKISEFWLKRLSNALHPPDRIFGSISHLALSTIPEALKALDFVGDWVRTLVYGQEYLPQTCFVPEVMRTATLALMFDRSQAGHLRNTPYFSATRPPPAYTRQEDGFVHKLLSSMSGDQTWSLTAGCLFVERVVRERSPINIVVLCDFLDLLCSSAILSQCGVHPGMPSLHSVIVPHSWLLRFASCDSMPYFNKGIHRTLLEPMRDLLQQLCTGRGCEHLLLYGTSRNISNVPYHVRRVFISRIFNAVGLLDYNIRDEFLCSDIQKLILSLRQIPVLYSRYIDAASRSWDELAEIIRHSLQYEAEDEMIQLVHRSGTPEQHHPLPEVRQLVYSDLTDIRAQLGLSVSTSTPTTPPHIEVPERKETDADASEVKEVGNTQEAEAVDAIPAPDTTTPTCTSPSKGS
ncbi:hypothetical protein EDD85DRAFT_800629 [Armillaria nabsnona]|nr:hypothetical protein EDD85DRAFT_800629 [Armillaria nabsnona]